jgi:hypothetical protein
MKGIGRTTLAAAIAASFATSAALAWIEPDPQPIRMFRLFAPEAKLSSDGRRIVVTGVADCGPAEGAVQVAVSVLQQDTLARARGFSTEQACTEAEDSFTAELAVREGTPAFVAGPVMACGMAQMRTEDGARDYDFWCTFVTLVTEAL